MNEEQEIMWDKLGKLPTDPFQPPADYANYLTWAGRRFALKKYLKLTDAEVDKLLKEAMDEVISQSVP